MATETLPWVFALVLVALSAVLIGLGWHFGQKTLIKGFRMGRLSTNQSDIGLLEAPKKGKQVRLEDEYDAFNEAMRDNSTGNVSTIGEGGRG